MRLSKKAKKVLTIVVFPLVITGFFIFIFSMKWKGHSKELREEGAAAQVEPESPPVEPEDPCAAKVAAQREADKRACENLAQGADMVLYDVFSALEGCVILREYEGDEYFLSDLGHGEFRDALELRRALDMWIHEVYLEYYEYYGGEARLREKVLQFERSRQ